NTAYCNTSLPYALIISNCKIKTMRTNFLKPDVYATALAFVAVACKKDKEKEPENHGINLAYMDTTVSPKEDFFRYVNGTWLDENEIPEDQTAWGSFNELRKNTDEDVLAILKTAMNDANLDKSSDQAKAVYYFESIMD